MQPWGRGLLCPVGVWRCFSHPLHLQRPAQHYDRVGNYNHSSDATSFFRDEGEWDSPEGEFFLKWYSQGLIKHGDRVLTRARRAFKKTVGSIGICHVTLAGLELRRHAREREAAVPATLHGRTRGGAGASLTLDDGGGCTRALFVLAQEWRL